MTTCPTCGRGRQGTATFWTHARIIAAIQRWVEEHGRTPRQLEWNRSGVWWPHEKTVRSVFGSWSAGIGAAGYEIPAGKRRAAA